MDHGVGRFLAWAGPAAGLGLGPSQWQELTCPISHANSWVLDSESFLLFLCVCVLFVLFLFITKYMLYCFGDGNNVKIHLVLSEVCSVLSEAAPVFLYT